MQPSLSERFRSGFVAMTGHPNVGKSTLINRFLGQKIAAVSPRPQTTRRKQLGILTTVQAQIIFIDTPGIHKPRHKLGEAMNQQARDALEEADQVLFIVDASQPPTSEDHILARLIQEAKRQTITLVVLNKIDLIHADLLAERQAQFQDLLPEARVFPISATRGDNCPALLETLIAAMPEGPQYFPEEQSPTCTNGISPWT